MLTHFVVLPVLIMVLLVAGLVRMVTSPFRYRRHRHWGYRQDWSGYGYNGCGYGGRRRGFGGGLLTVLGLLALERLLGRRW